MTVSRALRGERGVDAELVVRAKAAADQLGYAPDPAARALASRHSSHVGVLVPMLSNHLFVDLLEGVQRTLRPAGLQTLIGITHYDATEEEQVLTEQLLHRPAGMLLTGAELSPRAEQLLRRSELPCVHMMTLSAHAPSVGFSQEQAAASLTQRLLDKGRRRIAFAAAQLDPRTLQRHQGWRQTLQAAHAYEPELEWLNPAPSSMALGARMLGQIARQQPRVDAVFFCNDDLAQGALMEALRLGLKVPDDIAVVGFNDLKGSDQMLPPLTTVRTPRAAIGERAAELLLQLIRGQQPASTCIDLGFELVERGSG
jgi:LacI family transcriptional regulator, gluconate utilization system Gnt-I transcriptional repressor